MNIEVTDLHTKFAHLLALPETSLQYKSARCWLYVITNYLGEKQQRKIDPLDKDCFFDLYTKSKIAYRENIELGSVDQIANLICLFLGEKRDYVKKEMIKECQRLFLFEPPVSTRIKNHQLHKPSNQEKLPVLIVGAGAAAIALTNELNTKSISYHVIDGNDGAGGCWRSSNYVGARTDVANLMYAFSFNFKYPWREVYSTQPTMLTYLEDSAKKAFRGGEVSYSTRLLSADVIDKGKVFCKLLDLKSNQISEKFFSNVVFACGQLSTPYYPSEISGAVNTKYCTHTGSGIAVDCEKLNNVAIIGSAASAVQLANGLSRKKIRVDIYSRSNSWFYNVPHYHNQFSELLKALVDSLPLFAEIFRLVAHRDAIFGNLSKIELNRHGEPSEQLLAFQEDLTKNLIQMGLIEYVPDYLPGVKRILVDDGSFGRNINSGNVTIIKEKVKEISKNLVISESGVAKKYDHIFLATGFITDSFVGQAELTYKGTRLSDVWSKRPMAYCGIVIPEIPSVYVMYGPNTNGVVNGNIFWFLERQAEAISESLTEEFNGNSSRLNLQAKKYIDEYQRIVDFGNLRRSWGNSSKTGWYRHKSGFSVQNWPFSLAAYNLALQDFDDFKKLKETSNG